MPINVQNCRTQPTTVSLGNFNGGNFIPAVMGLHRHYTAANCLVALNPVMNHGVGISGVTSLDPQANPGGDTYFLPFATNEITSIVLPAPGGPGVQQSFLTTNLSGCMIYVDRVQGVPGSIVVYHANNQANAPGGNLGGQQPALELPACTAELNRLYNLARANLAAAPNNLNLIPAGNVAKPAYNAGARAEVNRKIGQARTNVEFTGGTIVFGRVNGANWELFWATYGSCEYDRPAYAPKGWFGHGHRNPTTSANPNYRMLGSAQFV
ncbi:hypothetical protein [Paraburkholderia sacchari]|uniref:hypothetical protein n=1 Tax=Paraburkholderia sacchari TaxID=159450 RepID=UPI000543083E|nr:hypothetical protein [Paraburkholderia sacchari]NLP60706.1 hypothetical protein [Paraburkholderia sacchari]